MVNISGKAAVGIAIVAVLLTAAYGTAVWMAVTEWVPPWVPPVTPPIIPTDAEYSEFKWTGIREDATTSVTGATTRYWFDANYDDVMQYSELGKFTESSGVYTSTKELPINIAPCDAYPDGVVFDLWVQSYVATYQLTYGLFHMTGSRNSDGSAKSVGELEHRLTDDSITWSGRMNGVDFDVTDYNYTLSGVTGTLEAEFTLSAADYGLDSQEWEGINYETVYGIDKAHPYYIRWDAISEGTDDAINVASTSIMAATFFSAYCTEAHRTTGQVNVGDFDYNYADGTNWYGMRFMTSAWGDLFYNTADASAPRPTIEFRMGTITGAGTFLATYGIGIWQDVAYDDMLSGSWTKGTDLAKGTCGDAWGWIA